MAGEVITVLQVYDTMPKNDDTFWGFFYRSCRHYGLTFRFISVEELWEQPCDISPLILGGGHSAYFLEKVEKERPELRMILPYNTVHSRYQNISGIGCSVRRLGQDVLSYCVEAGRSRLAMFAFDKYGTRMSPWVEGFLQASSEITDSTFSAADVFLNDENMLLGCFEKLYAHIDRYDAVICANDSAALYLITELKKRGVRVPEDVFVIGYGNSPTARRTSPSITSIEISEQSQAELCVSLWRFLKKHPDVRRADMTVAHKLAVRESTADFLPANDRDHTFFFSEGQNPDRGYNALTGLQDFLRQNNIIDHEIARMLLEGKSNVEIAEALFLSEGAVRYRIKNIMKCFSAQNKRELCEILRYYNVRF